MKWTSSVAGTLITVLGPRLFPTRRLTFMVLRVSSGETLLWFSQLGQDDNNNNTVKMTLGLMLVGGQYCAC